MSGRKPKRYNSLDSKRILIVEEHPEVATSPSQMLKEYDDIVYAKSGMQALEQIDRDPPDVIVLDSTLPDMSGLDVVRGLRLNDKTRHIPILAMSGSASERVKCMAAGCDDFIVKPFPIKKLLERLSRLVTIDQPFRL